MKTFLLLPISLSILLFSCAYSSKTATKMLEEAKVKKYDIIVVPGVPFNAPEWGKIMKGRIYWSKYLYDSGITKNIMFSGSSVYSPYYESKIMALYAEAIGIPKANIFTETKAEHSTENIYYSYKKAKKLGFKKIALASDHFQTKSLRNFTHRRFGSKVGFIPWVLPIIKELDPNMITPPIDYDNAFNDKFIPLKEREGFFKRLKGTFGRNINKHLYD